MADETILIVDDSPQFSEILREMLVSAGYRTLNASDGRAGLHAALEHHPDLIFLDMNMPVMDGLGMLQELRRTECASPVIFMTGYGSEQIAISVFRLGVRDYLQKPFNQDEAQKAIDRALRETRLLSERTVFDRRLQAAEAVRLTAVTLSHYINNYLTALNGNLQLLDESLLADEAHASLHQLLADSRKSSRKIEALVRALGELTRIKLASYAEATMMLDLQAAIERQLRGPDRTR